MTVPPCLVCGEPGTFTPIWAGALPPGQRKTAHLCGVHWKEWLDAQQEEDSD